MLSSRERYHTAFRDYMICRILGMTGVRVSECVALDLDVKKYAATSGITTYAGEFSAHSLRYSFAMESLKKTGGNLSLTQKLLGHEDISTTTIYAEATEEEIRNARNLF